ncbi:hypothetical protein CC85DRAFT_284332 [Cutaneotrichosporon oleaginosum]|uniref:Uncharacterized protein n=1 Tax=Cutaneotrichosporon oleaginosum TaxID=879819 RepID=A0A0J0XRA3_9TREE|nr:uncharacterized protein CC85DRAFT_284332 [Cutaneotrichosporon oleaginosum]KLT43625.1 hypothetical protein CC85DRAFT_284332 [Cutaneotrichosporon oleaginosum]TXT12707.1 hypothetical protein COLE_03117 [Cutaneotrichosporon oleaginosum]
MLAPKFKAQYYQLEKFGDDMTEAQQATVTQEMVAGAVACHIAHAWDIQCAKGKVDDKKAIEFCTDQAYKYTQQEFDNKGLEWRDRKMVEYAAAALVQAQIGKK